MKVNVDLWQKYSFTIAITIGEKLLFQKKKIDAIVSICFAYMIDAKKIAAIGFAMKTLHLFINHQDWIEEEFRAYIEQKLPNSSAGFRSLVNQFI